MDIAFGIVLIIAAVFLIFAVLMQSGKAKKLSGTIAGGAETFFGKTKGKAMDRLLARWTTIIAIIFVLLVLILFIVQDDAFDRDQYFEDANSSSSANAMVDTPIKVLLADGQTLTL